MEIILGSNSPRREEILRFFSVPFVQIAPLFEEEKIIFKGDPKGYVEEIAQEKAKLLSQKYPDKVILSADTTVYCKGKIYNKPSSKEEARLFLKDLSGEWHSVFTGVALYTQGEIFSQAEETRLLFHDLKDSQIEAYLNHINFLDKAGSYAIQQTGAIVVKKIEGCYYNVMGLPLTALKELLAKAGIDLWNHLKIL